ncbi:ATP-binding protein [Ramlibacter sp. PS3R-8]|uniref:ATP-binding protein n=1 Tax=Ramlibacter sp. PS3R-8 TaxID=3133437 RepID=UPI00309B8D20
MLFVILRLLRHNELGVFHAYRRRGKERAKQRAINFDGEVVDRVFPAAKDTDDIALLLRYQVDDGVGIKAQRLRRQHKNWRLEGNCPEDYCYDFVEPGCLFAMVVDAGQRPALGAWAVYAVDNQATKAILADGESNGLAGRSMVALHGDEGRRTLAVLQKSKPDLFMPEESPVTKPKPAMTMAAEDRSVRLPPNARRLVRILASVGHTLPSAVADIVDNAISADATDIRITFGRPDSGHGRWMTIADNGRGMDAARLAEAMRIGSETDYESDDLGKYGYGLKGASWSQTDCFTVVSKVMGQPAAHLTWDVARMDSWDAQRSDLDPWIAARTEIPEHGTCVLWRSMRPPRSTPALRGLDPYTAEVQELHRHLGLVFHRFIEGKVPGRKRVIIRVEGIVVEANNPVGHSATKAYDMKSVRVPTPTENATVRVQAFLLPSEQEVKAIHGTDVDAARMELDRLGMYGRRNESQGLYVYRNGRLIQWGGWHQMWTTSDEKTKLARVVVDFDSTLDDQFDVNISKRMVTLSQQLQAEIKRLAVDARNDSKKKYVSSSRVLSSGRASGSSATSALTKLATTAKTSTPAANERATTTSATSDLPVVRLVKTDAFAWKLMKGMTGKQEIQVSGTQVELCNLLASIATDAVRLKALAEFLTRLDQAGAQKLLVSTTAPK